jgi:calcineurin-like phosphoesterase family protein
MVYVGEELMLKTYFIGDTHFGHSNILKFEPYYRPYKDIKEHDEALIDLWNSTVNKNDTVWHLGDFAFGSQNVKVASRLNGIKHLVMGNHDTAPSSQYVSLFHKIHGSATYKGYILSHIPVYHQKHRFKGNIHGHLHSKVIKQWELIETEEGELIEMEMNDRWYINVSCEQIGNKPISFEELLDKYK